MTWTKKDACSICVSDLQSASGVCLLPLLSHHALVQSRAQHTQSSLAVLQLRAELLALGHGSWTHNNSSVKTHWTPSTSGGRRDRDFRLIPKANRIENQDIINTCWVTDMLPLWKRKATLKRTHWYILLNTTDFIDKHRLRASRTTNTQYTNKPNINHY